MLILGPLGLEFVGLHVPGGGDKLQSPLLIGVCLLEAAYGPFGIELEIFDGGGGEVARLTVRKQGRLYVQLYEIVPVK